MAKSVTVRLPWPPSVNHYWINSVILPRSWGPAIKGIVPHFIWKKIARRFVADGHYPRVWVVVGEVGEKFRVDVQAEILQRFGLLKPLACRMKVTYVVVQPDRRIRDLSNLLKAVEDSLTHANVWEDDGQIDDFRMVRGGVKAPGYIDVTIEKMPDQIEQKELFQESGDDELRIPTDRAMAESTDAESQAVAIPSDVQQDVEGS